jgi:hypothetical protein
MFRFTIRDWLWLIVVVVVGAILCVIPSRRGNGRRTATRRVSEQELETIRARYEAAKGEFDFHAARTLGSGVWPSADEYCSAIERFAQAAEARDNLEARVKDLASALDFAQHKASASLDKYESDVAPASEVYRYQYTRADMEARLRRAEQDLAAAQATR